jgi:peptide/nickel transport system ATP-binding protein
VWLVYLETLNALPADWPRRRPRPAWPALPAHHRRTTRRRVGLVFQDALSSFDPRYTVGQVVAEALPKSRSHEGADLLDRVGLDPTLASRRPVSLSGESASG